MTLTRANALLRVGNDADAAPAEVEPPAAEFGADDAVAYRWPDGVVATVYVFGALADARVAEDELAKSTPPPQTTVNGGLLLSVVAPAEAADHAQALVSGFAGRE